jgi:type I restriction enzyme S subunit
MKPGWRRVRFGDVVRLNKETSKDPAADGLERYVGLEHIEPGDLRIRSWGQIAHGTTFTNRFRPGQVLFGKRRAYQRKVAVADFDGICSGDIYVFEPTDGSVLLPDLLPFICQTDAFFDHAVGTSAGSLSPRTNWGSLAEFGLALPPLEEQRRIVAALHSVNDLVNVYRDAIDKAGFVQQAHIADLYAKHNNHRWRLGDFVTFITSGSRGWARYYSETGDWFLRVTNLQPKSISLDLSDLKLVNIRGDPEGNRTKIQPGDILIAVTGEYLGMISVASADIPLAYVNQHIAIVRVDQSKLDARFVAHCYASSIGQQQIWRFNDGGTKPGMNLDGVRRLPVLDLPIESQRAADRVLSDLDDRIGSLTKRIHDLEELKAFISLPLSSVGAGRDALASRGRGKAPRS